MGLWRQIKVEEVRGGDGVRAILAEGLATFMFVILATGAVVGSGVAMGGELDAARLAVIAFGAGLAITSMVAAFGRISGAHLNPAVTFAAVVTGKMGAAKGLSYVVFQAGGAIAAPFMLKAILPATLEYGLGAHGISPEVRAGGFNEPAGFGLEVLLTFFLVFVIFSVAFSRHGPGFPLAPIAIGLVVTTDLLVGAPLTGASMNPARSLGPAWATGDWNAHWIYWIGPLVGAALAGVLFQRIFEKR